MVRQFTLLFRSIKGAAHGMNFEHIPVEILRLCAIPLKFLTNTTQKCQAFTQMFSFRLSVPWSFPLVVRQFTLLFRSIKGAAHGMSFEHMPVTVLRLCANRAQRGPNPPPQKSMLSCEAVAEPQSSTGPSREWQCNIDLGGREAQSVTQIGVH